MDHKAACMAQCGAGGGGAVFDQCVVRDFHFGQPQLSWTGDSTARRRLGRYGARRIRLSGDQPLDESGTWFRGQSDRDGILRDRTIVQMTDREVTMPLG